MKAIIYKPTKNAMQSGKKAAKRWLLEFEHDGSRFISVLGWTGSKDMNQEIKLYFDEKEQAIRYAEKNNLNYEVKEPEESSIIIKSYADNFKYKP